MIHNRIRIKLKTGLKILLVMMIFLGATGCAKTVTFEPAVIQTAALKIPDVQYSYQEMISFNVISQTKVGKDIVCKANMKYQNENAVVTGIATIKFQYVDNKWKDYSHELEVTKVDVKVQPDQQAVINSIHKLIGYDGPWIPVYGDIVYTLDSTTKLSDTKVRMDFKYEAALMNWHGLFHTIIDAEYSISSGWHYKLTDWTYTDTTDWAGTWEIQWMNQKGIIDPQKQTFVITGQSSFVQTKSGNLNVTNTILVNFDKDGTHYGLPASLDLSYQPSTRSLKIILPNSSTFNFNVETFIEDIPLNGDSIILPGAYYAWDSNNNNSFTFERLR